MATSQPGCFALVANSIRQVVFAKPPSFSVELPDLSKTYPLKPQVHINRT